MSGQAMLVWATDEDRVRGLDVRERSETVLARSEYLDASDRALVRAVLGAGVKPREVAAVSGLSERTVQRRVRRIVERLMDEGVMYVLRNYRTWPRVTGKVAMARWVKGRTLREVAAELELSLHQVRRECDKISGRLTAAGVIHELGKSRE